MEEIKNSEDFVNAITTFFKKSFELKSEFEKLTDSQIIIPVNKKTHEKFKNLLK